MMIGVWKLSYIFSQSRHVNLALARLGLIWLKPLEPTTKRGTPNPKTMRGLFKSKSFLLSNRQNVTAKIY